MNMLEFARRHGAPSVWCSKRLGQWSGVIYYQHTPIDAKHMQTMPADSAANGDFESALQRMGLLAAHQAVRFTPLTGGVSSDIVRADLPSGPICMKRALPKLKVSADWQAPVERNRWEVQWMRVASAIAPHAVPRVLGEDARSGTFAMEYLDPAHHPIWKTQLRDGEVDSELASQVGEAIGRIHSRTAHRSDLAEQFATDHIFFPIRLEPYLAAAARAHPDYRQQLHELIDVTRSTKLALVHGDVSPKNILCGPQGPVFLDAECAWYGDPAFDLAFCLNHMLLKCAWRPQWTAGYLTCFEQLAHGYLKQVDWEAPAAIETRTAHLLPGLFLARVDGKSPVEYVTQDWQRELVRKVAKRFLSIPTARLTDIGDTWREAVTTSDARDG